MGKNKISKKKDKKGIEQYVMVSVREAGKALAVGYGQGYIKCAFTGKCARANAQKCSCRKAKLPCSSKCHGKQFICSTNEQTQ